jgi:hypothetical protein
MIFTCTNNNYPSGTEANSYSQEYCLVQLLNLRKRLVNPATKETGRTPTAFLLEILLKILLVEFIGNTISNRSFPEPTPS